MIRMTSPEVVNETLPAVTSGIYFISWLSMPRISTVLPGCLDMTLVSLPVAPPLTHLSNREHVEERLTLDKQ